MLEVEREFREVRLPLAMQYGIDNGINRITVDPTDAWIGLVATGFTYREMLDALRVGSVSRANGRSRTPASASSSCGCRFRSTPDLVRRFAAGLDEIVVVEEKNPTLEWLIKDALYGGPDQPRVVGKHHEDGRTLMRAWGQLDADAIIDGLRARLTARLGRPPPPDQSPTIERELHPAHGRRGHRSSVRVARTTGGPRFPTARSSAPAPAATA